jgi:hypothetical protein
MDGWCGVGGGVMVGKHNLVSSLLKELGARGDAKSPLHTKPKGNVISISIPLPLLLLRAHCSSSVGCLHSVEVLTPEEETKRLARREKLVGDSFIFECTDITHLLGNNTNTTWI